MKVEGTGKSQQAGKSKSKGKVSSGDSSFGDLVTGGVQESKESSATQSIAQIDSLLAVQAAENPTEKATRKRMRERAEDILKGLEDIRIALLTGNLTVGHVINIADVVAVHREKIIDPELTAILDEIDLRAQIEIAKIKMAMDRS
jgi:cysteine sulfinate desulfinase/cysteine desulfurase-like protein